MRCPASESDGSRPVNSQPTMDSRIHANDPRARGQRRGHGPFQCQLAERRLFGSRLLDVAEHETFVAKYRFSHTMRNGSGEEWPVRHKGMELSMLTAGIRCLRKIC